MNICLDHWEKLKLAISTRGLSDFVAPSSEEAHRQIVHSLVNPDELRLENFDPLMAANNMIYSYSLEVTQRAGIPMAMIFPDPDTGKMRCPLCFAAGPKDQNWIDGAADQAAAMVADLRKGPVNLKKAREEHGQAPPEV